MEYLRRSFLFQPFIGEGATPFERAQVRVSLTMQVNRRDLLAEGGNLKRGLKRSPLLARCALVGRQWNQKRLIPAYPYARYDLLFPKTSKNIIPVIYRPALFDSAPLALAFSTKWRTLEFRATRKSTRRSCLTSNSIYTAAEVEDINVISMTIVVASNFRNKLWQLPGDGID